MDLSKENSVSNLMGSDPQINIMGSDPIKTSKGCKLHKAGITDNQYGFKGKGEIEAR